MRPEKLAPGRAFPSLGSRVDSIPLQDVGYRRSANSVADIQQSTLDSGVPPAWILASHADRQFRDDLHDPTSPGGPSLVGPFLSNQLPVPPKDGVRSNKRRNLGKSTLPDGFAADREPATLIVGQSEASAAELLLQDAVLLSKVFDYCVLMAVDPAGERGHEDLPGLEHSGHPEIVTTPRDNRQVSAGGETG